MTAEQEHDEQSIRVMLVDDSAVVRGLMSRALQQNPNIHIVATASDGDMAINVLQRNPVDVIILDIEMPKKDGLEALPILLAMAPHTHVIMASSLTQRNASISLRALEIGAADYVPKPSSRGDNNEIQAFYDELTNKVLHLGEAAKKKQLLSAPSPVERISRPFLASAASIEQKTEPASLAEKPALMLHPGSAHAIAIASSTGGPQALVKLLSAVSPVLKKTPVFITQHMPATFTALLAEHLSTDTGLPCKEAVDGELVSSGSVYVAPGNYHMIIDSDTSPTIRLNQDPPVNFCRPAADPMLGSLAKCYGKHLLSIVLTGMGNDGAAGALKVREAGGKVIVQDEESSVVWGMPGAVVAAHAHHAILTIDEMVEQIKQGVRI